jgi:hypothetical protein
MRTDLPTNFNRGIDDTSSCYWELNFCFVGYSAGLVMIQCCCNTDLCNDGGFTNSTPSTPPSATATVFGGSGLSLMTLLLMASNYF